MTKKNKKLTITEAGKLYQSVVFRVYKANRWLILNLKRVLECRRKREGTK